MKPALLITCFLCCLLAAVYGFSYREGSVTTQLDKEDQLLVLLKRKPYFDTVGFYTDAPSSDFLVHLRFLMAPQVFLPTGRYDSSACFIAVKDTAALNLSRLTILWQANDSTTHYLLTIPKQ